MLLYMFSYITRILIHDFWRHVFLELLEREKEVLCENDYLEDQKAYFERFCILDCIYLYMIELMITIYNCLNLHLSCVDGSSAVSMLGGNSGYSVGNLIRGVIRFAETPEGCIVDGTIDGLTPGEHGMHIHECGDISNGCDR